MKNIVLDQNSTDNERDTFTFSNVLYLWERSSVSRGIEWESGSRFQCLLSWNTTRNLRVTDSYAYLVLLFLIRAALLYLFQTKIWRGTSSDKVLSLMCSTNRETFARIGELFCTRGRDRMDSLWWENASPSRSQSHSRHGRIFRRSVISRADRFLSVTWHMDGSFCSKNEQFSVGKSVGEWCLNESISPRLWRINHFSSNVYILPPLKEKTLSSFRVTRSFHQCT